MKGIQFHLEESDLQDAVLDILEPIATDGLIALKKVLDESGFADSPYLKDYELESEISNEDVTFSILLNERAISDETRRKLRKETDAKLKKSAQNVGNRPEAREYVRSYMMSPNGRPERVQGRRDARKRRTDGRTFPRDARTKAEDRDRVKRTKQSGERYVEHELELTAPRNVEVDPDGKLRISMQREIRQSGKKMIYPQGNFQGIMDKFLGEIASIISEEFGKNLDQIMKRHTT
jgi:hypothetical protein